MKRETIETEEDLIDIYREGKHSYFDCVDYEVVDRDLVKAYEDVEMVAQRKSDGKFFKFEFIESQYSDLSENDFPLEGTEVFPEIVTKVIYK